MSTARHPEAIALPNNFKSGVYVCDGSGGRKLYIWRLQAMFANPVRWDLMYGGGSTQERTLHLLWTTSEQGKMLRDLDVCDRAIRGELMDDQKPYQRTDFAAAHAADHYNGMPTGTVYRGILAQRARKFLSSLQADAAMMQQMLNEEAALLSPATCAEQWDVVGRAVPSRRRRGPCPPPAAASTSTVFAALCEGLHTQGERTSNTLDLLHALQQRLPEILGHIPPPASAAPCRALLENFFRPLMLQGGGGLAACRFGTITSQHPGCAVASDLQAALLLMEMLLFAQVGCERMQEQVMQMILPAVLPQAQWRGHALKSPLSLMERQPTYQPPPLSRRTGSLRFPPSVMTTMYATASGKRPHSPSPPGGSSPQRRRGNAATSDAQGPADSRDLQR